MKRGETFTHEHNYETFNKAKAKNILRFPLGSTQYFATATTKLTEYKNVFHNSEIPNPFGTRNHPRNLMKTSPVLMGGKKVHYHKILDKTLRISCLERYVGLKD